MAKRRFDERICPFPYVPLKPPIYNSDNVLLLRPGLFLSTAY